ncbi:hypothetical protein CSA56_08630 [candidate division KSB3 bacterium]|uniref:Uncharacterized protein n=1 Tax=candidate division KSB3 bacterium TaxID=2044937 RepID=A0A2G6KET9_9BACT|nr:MAG: hypothetical protein CSA56_08630 [candidate division KSB3 bacterium]
MVIPEQTLQIHSKNPTSRKRIQKKLVLCIIPILILSSENSKEPIKTHQKDEKAQSMGREERAKTPLHQKLFTALYYI